MTDPLATPLDAERLGYDLPEGKAEQLLARASNRLRRAAGQPITSATSTVRLPVDRGEVVLPSPPVTAVTAVAVVACDQTTNPITGWCWDGGDRITGVCAAAAQVTFTHGYPVVPEELVDLTCSVAERLGNTTAGMTAGVRSESIDDYSVTYAAEAVETASGLLPGELAALSEFVPTGDVAVVRSR
ncbi:hypothetical protein ACU686_40500 [Yinghuangia aomiensis]